MKSVGGRHMNGGSSKNNRPTSHQSNPINQTSTEVHVKTKSSNKDKTQSSSKRD